MENTRDLPRNIGYERPALVDLGTLTELTKINGLNLNPDVQGGGEDRVPSVPM